MIKLSRRSVLRIGILITVISGMLVGIALLPGKIEGVYKTNWIVCMCDCERFFELREGKVIEHVMDEEYSQVLMGYEREETGSVLIRFKPKRDGVPGDLVMRADPHLLVTRFVSLESGKSHWFWKLPITKRFANKMSSAKIKESVYENGGMRFFNYDSRFNVISSTFRPYSMKSGPLPNKPAVPGSIK